MSAEVEYRFDAWMSYWGENFFRAGAESRNNLSVYCRSKFELNVQGEHEKPWGSSYAAIADNVPLL